MNMSYAIKFHSFVTLDSLIAPLFINFFNAPQSCYQPSQALVSFKVFHVMKLRTQQDFEKTVTARFDPLKWKLFLTKSKQF